ncbi:exocyst subunit exo70 family protein F1 [Wolffia australiana]
MEASVEGEERVIAAAQQIVRSLGTSKNMKEDILLILSTFDNRFSNITDLVGGGGNARLTAAEEVISRWGDSSVGSSFRFLPWEESPEEVAEYLAAVDDVISLSEDPDLLNRAEIALQTAMERLEEEFRRVMVQNAESFDAARLYVSCRSLSASFASGAALGIDDYDSYVEDDHEGYAEGGSFRGSFSEDLSVGMVKAEAIPHLKSIADRMIRAAYENECCQVFCSVRREFLDESIAALGFEKLSIEDVQKIAWSELDLKMKKWAQALKVVFLALLLGEKKLCDQIFEASPSVGESCFASAARACVMQLLNFAEAVAIVQRSPEKLFRLLDMYDALSSIIPELQTLFPEEAKEFLLGEADLILRRLGTAAKETLAMFENAVQKETSRKSMQFGDIHPLTRYVMNYDIALMEYEGTLNELLGRGERDGFDDSEGSQLAGNMTRLGQRVLSTIAFLESNIEEKSKLYEDSGLQYIFLINNLHYIVQKVKGSELLTVLGDDWVKKRRGQIKQHARSYLRASWTRILSFLRDDGMSGSGSSGNTFKLALKDKFKNFNLAFEEIIKVQSTWNVSDHQLREELRISISDMLIPAYRSFTGRYGSYLEGGRNSSKYKKYTPDDLETCLSDLFEGSSSGLSSHPRRKH